MVFKFRLEKVLVLRQEAVDRAQKELIKSQLALKQAKEKTKALIEDLRHRHEELIKNNYQLAQDHLRVIKHTKTLLEKAQKHQADCEQAVIQARKALLDAQKELEALQKLKEKQAEAYHLEANRVEQKETDEKNALKYATDKLKKNSNP